MDRKLKHWELALMLGILIAAVAGGWLGQEQRELADSVIRFHVIANSDSEEDQALKLAVRDRVLAQAETLYPPNASLEEARAALEGNLNLQQANDSYESNKKNYQELMEQMRAAASSQAAAKTFSDVCEKNDFLLIDNRAEWVSFADFLSNLPTTRTQDYTSLLDKSGIQEMKANDARYYFDFTSVCRKGNVAPLEMVSDNIRRILLTQRRSEIIKAHEEQIVSEAVASGHALIYKEDADEPTDDGSSAEE